MYRRVRMKKISFIITVVLVLVIIPGCAKGFVISVEYDDSMG